MNKWCQTTAETNLSVLNKDYVQPRSKYYDLLTTRIYNPKLNVILVVGQDLLSYHCILYCSTYLFIKLSGLLKLLLV